MPLHIRPKPMFWRTVFHGSSANCWNTTERSGPGRSTSLPPTVTVPVEGKSSPAAMRINVVLPQPDGPTTATNSRSSTLRSMRSSARKPVLGSPKRLVMPVKTMSLMQAMPQRLLTARSAARSATSIRKPTTPMPSMPAMTVVVLTDCPGPAPSDSRARRRPRSIPSRPAIASRGPPTRAGPR